MSTHFFPRAGRFHRWNLLMQNNGLEEDFYFESAPTASKWCANTKKKEFHAYLYPGTRQRIRHYMIYLGHSLSLFGEGIGIILLFFLMLLVLRVFIYDHSCLITVIFVWIRDERKWSNPLAIPFKARRIKCGSDIIISSVSGVENHVSVFVMPYHEALQHYS